MEESTGTLEPSGPDHKKDKSYGANFRKRFNKAMFIMSKIKCNERKGTPQASDKKTRQRCERIIIDYRRYRRTVVEAKQKEKIEQKMKETGLSEQEIEKNIQSEIIEKKKQKALNSGKNKFSSPPSPPFWRQLSSSTPASEQHKYYLSRLERMKMYAKKGKLNRQERIDEKNCRRAIRKYEDRNSGKPAEANNDGKGLQNDEGFQLSVNYLESEDTGGKREQMEEFSHSSWEEQTSSNGFPGDQQDTPNWGANSSWNCGQMESESYQRRGGNSSFNKTDFGGVNSSRDANNYESEWKPYGRPESSWNHGNSETDTLFERRNTGESFNPQNNFEFAGEQRPNRSWNYGMTQSGSYQEMRGNRQSQDFNFKGRNNFDSGFREMKQPEENFRSNRVSNGLWNDYNPEFERRGSNPFKNSQKLKTYSSNRNNFESTTAWNYDERKEDNFNSSNPQFMRSNFSLESKNSPQELSSYASTSKGNMMTHSGWNHFDSTQRLQSSKESSTLSNKSNTEEDSAKILLEKKIFDMLNALSEDNTDEEQFNRDKHPNNHQISQTNLNNARENLSISSRKPQEKSNESQNRRTWSSSTYNNNTPIPNSRNSNNQFTQQNNSFNSALWNPSATSTYSSANNNPQLQIAIIDRNEPDLKITKRLWSKMEGNLNKALHLEVEKTNNTNITLFDAKEKKYGIRIIQCESLEALNFIKRFINNYALQNPHQQYDVIPISELPKRSMVKVWIPPPIARDQAMLEILKEQNHTLYSDCWSLINSRMIPNKNGKELCISISAASVESLRFVKGEIRFGINCLKMELIDEHEFEGEQ